MARGWESKSVEEQQSVAREPQAPPSQQTEAERRRARELETLRLARARIVQQLEATHDERYAAQLRAALEDLNRRIADSRGRGGAS